jgi:hypothetical protein
MAPTAQELAMRDVPGHPGAAAAVLLQDEVDRDEDQSVTRYERIKILSEEGKKYANVHLEFVSTSMFSDMVDYAKTVSAIEGRTIHADGKVIPFTGKPYIATEAKLKGAQRQAKVFTLPDVEVGSIVEYRYTTRTASLDPPDWYIQGDLYVMKAHYKWYPTNERVVDSQNRTLGTITWYSQLPQGTQLLHERGNFEVYATDVPAEESEEMMPPVESYSYRVLFNYSSYKNGEEYWNGAGMMWSREENDFIGPVGKLSAAAAVVTAGAETPDDKLRKIYAAVMAMENTSYTRERDKREDKAVGFKLKTVADVLAVKRGSPTQLTELFVGIARAAGLTASLMLVPDRSENLFEPNWWNFRQFDTVIAVVNVDGKEVFFDPGSRYCRYGHLAWWHTLVRGLRQSASGTGKRTEFAMTPTDGYQANGTARTANLTMDEQGEVKGKISLLFQGSAALRWRHVALRGDEQGLKHELQETLEDVLPKTLEVKLLTVDNLEIYEAPLSVTFEVTGKLGAPVGKRMMLPAEVFVAGELPMFPGTKRELPVYFHYPQQVQDAVQVNLPKELKVESVPLEAKFKVEGKFLCTLAVKTTETSVVTRRTYVLAELVVPTKEYDELRKFTTDYEAKDQESVVLKAGS